MRLFFKCLFLVSCAVSTAYAADIQPSAPLKAQDVLTKLKEGNKRFVDNKLTYCLDLAKAREQARTTHLPSAAILSCSDARVGPEILYDQGIGDLFVVRVAGNVASDFGIGSLEYATQYLSAPLIVVLGHTNCGAMDAFLKTLQKGSFLEGHIEALVLSAYPATERLKNLETATGNDMVVANVKTVRDSLTKESPLLAKRVKAGSLKIVGAVYDLNTGLVTFLEDDQN